MESFSSYDLKRMLQKIHVAHGYDFTGYAESSIKRRTENFMRIHRLRNLDSLEASLLADEKTFDEFVLNVSVTVTEMFRDPSFYKALREKIIERLKTYPFFKIWVAGCATGEEVYSLAIILKEEGLLDRALIYATDINQHSLAIAREGIFPLELMKTYTTNYFASGGTQAFSDYYITKYELALFDKSLKKNMVIAPHNLVSDNSFNEFQLILCRNVLIYFKQELQNRVINLFYDSLCMFGYLALGSKESLLFTDKRDHFKIVDKKEKIFVKQV